MAFDTRRIARGPRFVFENGLTSGELVEVMLVADFQYECWMLTAAVLWRSPFIKGIAGFSKEG